MKRDLLIGVILLLLVAGLCYGLAAVRPPFPPITREVRAMGAHSTSDKKQRVVMRVNDEPITEREFMAFLLQAPEDMQPFYASPDGRQALATEMVKLKTLEQEAHRLKLDDDPVFVSRIGIERAKLLAGAVLRKIVPLPSEARIQEEYKKQKGSFDSLDLSHILVAYAGGQIPPRRGKPLPAPQAMAKATSIVNKLRAGSDFATLARAESDDVTSAEKGGHLGMVTRGSMPPNVDVVAMNLKSGEISKPVQSMYGVHIFKAGEHRDLPLNTETKQGLANVLQRKDLEATIAKMQKEARVDLDPEFFPKKKGS